MSGSYSSQKDTRVRLLCSMFVLCSSEFQVIRCFVCFVLHLFFGNLRCFTSECLVRFTLF